MCLFSFTDGFTDGVSLMLLPYFDVFCDLLLNRHTATWNLHVFVLYHRQKKVASDDVIYASALE